MAGKYDKLIMRTAREQFVQAGFCGSRIDSIAQNAKINRKMIYDFCHTKDEIYMTVLSEVARDVMERFNEAFLQMNGSIQNIYAELFDVLENSGDFVRLWAWERMFPTIHGPRILETANVIFEKTRNLIIERSQRGLLPQIDANCFEAIEALCHGYMLTAAMYFRCDPETDAIEEQTSEHSNMQNSPALRRLDMSMNIQNIVLNSIEHVIRDTVQP